MSDVSPFIVLAAGGTGGHIFPAEALARELMGRGYRVALMTDQRGSKFSDDLLVPIYRVRASALGKGMLGKIRSVVEMGIGVLQARHRLSKLRPAIPPSPHFTPRHSCISRLSCMNKTPSWDARTAR